MTQHSSDIATHFSLLSDSVVAQSKMIAAQEVKIEALENQLREVKFFWKIYDFDRTLIPYKSEHFSAFGHTFVIDLYDDGEVPEGDFRYIGLNLRMITSKRDTLSFSFQVGREDDDVNGFYVNFGPITFDHSLTNYGDPRTISPEDLEKFGVVNGVVEELDICVTIRKA